MERRNLVTPGTIISPHLFTYFILNLLQSLQALLRNNDTHHLLQKSHFLQPKIHFVSFLQRNSLWRLYRGYQPA